MKTTREIDFIPDRLNEEPVVFLSMTETELKYSFLAALAISAPVTLLIGLMLGQPLYGAVCSLPVTLGVVWLVGKRLKVVKRGRPKQYHMMALRAWLQDRGLSSGGLIRESTVWGIQRGGRKV